MGDMRGQRLSCERRGTGAVSVRVEDSGVEIELVPLRRDPHALVRHLAHTDGPILLDEHVRCIHVPQPPLEPMWGYSGATEEPETEELADPIQTARVLTERSHEDSAPYDLEDQARYACGTFDAACESARTYGEIADHAVALLRGFLTAVYAGVAASEDGGDLWLTRQGQASRAGSAYESARLRRFVRKTGTVVAVSELQSLRNGLLCPFPLREIAGNNVSEVVIEVWQHQRRYLGWQLEVAMVAADVAAHGMEKLGQSEAATQCHVAA